MTTPLFQLHVLGIFQITTAPDSLPSDAVAQESPGQEVGARLRRKSRALLAYLAANRQGIPRQQLAGLLFPESNDPLGALRWQLSDIRRQLDKEILVVHRDTVQLNPDQCWVDAHFFEATLATQTSSSSANERAEAMMTALHLYRGDYLTDISLPDAPEFEVWLLGQRAHFSRLFDEGLVTLIDLLIELRQYTDALPWTRRLLQQDPLSGDAVPYMMLLYAETGQREAALEQYEQYRQLLQNEIGERPEPAVNALRDQIASSRTQVATDPPLALSSMSSTPMSSSLVSPTLPHNLPAQTVPIVGREVEQTQLRTMLIDPSYRILTVVGPGGIGKTRLAMQIATDLARQQDSPFVDGIYATFLAVISSVDTMIPAIADAVGLSLAGTLHPRQQLLSYLQPRRLLLVLDNFEHLVDEAEFVAEIIQSAGAVTVLVTSRVRLNIYEEWTFNLHGLHIPNPDKPEPKRIGLCGEDRLV